MNFYSTSNIPTAKGLKGLFYTSPIASGQIYR